MHAPTPDLDALKSALERQDAEWASACRSLSELDPACQFLVDPALLAELEALSSETFSLTPGPMPFGMRV
jgi:hypothetical protein